MPMLAPTDSEKLAFARVYAEFVRNRRPASTETLRTELLSRGWRKDRVDAVLRLQAIAWKRLLGGFTT